MRSGERHAGNCAINYPIQGSATEIFKRIIIAILETVPMDKFVLQVHDEQLLEGPHALRADLLAWIAGFWTPLETSIISRWQ
jgi:DNA polymerase I-like protein with 3'-5' exonuclease and polymerase domains